MKILQVFLFPPDQQNRTNVLFRGMTLTLAVSLYLLGLTGCNNKSTPLLQDNPFSEQTKTLTTVTILSCQGYVFELPAPVSLAELTHWPKLNEASNSNGTTIDQNARNIWAQNGLNIAIAPISSWPQLRKQLIEAGAHSIYENQFWLRNTKESAEFDTAWRDKDTSFFVTGPDNQLNGYSASPGTCLLRFNATPLFTTERENQLRFNLVPIYRSEEKKTAMVYNEKNGYKIQRDQQIIVFKELLLSGIIDTESFIAIAISDKNEVIGNLGRYFLMNRDKKGDAQRVLFLVPKRIEAKRATSPTSGQKAH